MCISYAFLSIPYSQQVTDNFLVPKAQGIRQFKCLTVNGICGDVALVDKVIRILDD
jgi:hypothetical protein